MNFRGWYAYVSVVAGCFLAIPLLAQQSNPTEYFEKQVRPIFATKCYSCHSGQTPAGGLNFTSPAAFSKVIVKDDVAQSRLYQAISYSGRIKMPPTGKLPDQEIASIKKWIEMGAPQPSYELFATQIRPILATKCFSCHSGQTPPEGLNFTSAAALDKVIVKGKPAESRLYQAISYSGKIKMPPTGKLPDQEIASIKNWIEQGAPQPLSASGDQSGKKFWSFQPLRDTKPPEVKNKAWVRTPIDQFILAKLEEKGLQPAPPASKMTLLRRVTYDLTGLPPTPQEIKDFLADSSKDAYSAFVTRLLASPRYGEQWGRHWLDVARYADSTGMDEDVYYPNAWRYRDYVVKAFNDDLPYDRFVTEQLAGDLVPTPIPGAVNQRGIIATGFLALGPKPLDQQDRTQTVYDVVDEQIDTVSKAFLGLTISCARCHDHKFDPITQKDYYSLASIFASTKAFRNLGRPGGGVSYVYCEPLDPVAYDAYQTHRLAMYAKQLQLEEVLAADRVRQSEVLQPQIADFLTAAWKVECGGASLKAATESQGLDTQEVSKWVQWLHSADKKAREGYLKDLMSATEESIPRVAHQYQEDYVKAASAFETRLNNWRIKYTEEVLQDRELPERPNANQDSFFGAATFNGGPGELKDSPRAAQLRTEWKELEKSMPPEPAMANAVRDGSSVQQNVFLHGDHNNIGAPVPKQFPAVLAGDNQTPITIGSGRFEFARWLVSPDNPLTARVMVNRIWQWHFGEGLVRTPNNFGKMGEAPDNPELLDFLAKQFIASGWSIKALQKMILLSSVYQMDSRTTKELQEADPENRLFAHFNRLRMSVEQIRDSFLALSGKLDLTEGGPITGALAKDGAPQIDPVGFARRTMYLPVQRGNIPTVLETFDYGDATTSNEGRPRTNVAPQALFMMNSRFVLEQAGGFARKLLDNSDLSDNQRIQRAYLMALTRQPKDAETDSALTYISSLENRLKLEGQTEPHFIAWRSFCHILMSSNEFIYLN